jgi:glutathione S-transferase
VLRLTLSLSQVPALQEGDWVLPESCAILRYLCNSRRVDDAWYPVRPRDRARVDAALDWHHATLRRGAAALVFARVFAGNAADVAADPVRACTTRIVISCLPCAALNEPALTPQLPAAQTLRESAAILKLALRQLEEYWLAGSKEGGALFVGGFAQRPSIADLVLAAEVSQLSMLPRGEGDALLEGWPRVRAWLSAVEAATAPHWADVSAQAATAVSAIRPPGAKL